MSSLSIHLQHILYSDGASNSIVINQHIPLNNGSKQALPEVNRMKGFTLILVFPMGMDSSKKVNSSKSLLTFMMKVQTIKHDLGNNPI